MTSHPRMTTLLRWFKFNLVGALGMALQLTTLTLLNHLFHGHYLYATAAALELTLLHNFLWHLHYTWGDRRPHTPWPRALLRFHLTNGLISLLGNLVIMRLLIRTAHLPLLVANAIAILFCSIANFYAGNKWTFADPPARLLSFPRLTGRVSTLREPTAP